MPTSVGAQARELSNRLLIVWPTPDASGWRQLPLTSLVLLVAFLLRTYVQGSETGPLVAAAAVSLAVQACASLGRPGRWPPGWQMALPLGQMLAIVLLELGSGERAGTTIILLFVPGVSLALAPGVRPLAAGLIAVVVANTTVFLLTDLRYPLLHATIGSLLVGALMLHVHAIMDTTRRQEEQLLAARDLMRSIMSAATEQAIMATDASGRLVAASSGAEQLFGIPRDGLLGRDLPELVQASDGVSLEQLMGGALGGGTHVSQWPHTRHGTSGIVEYVVTARRAAEPGAGPAVGYLVVATDVTERVEDQRRQEQFIGLVSHELRTPLVSILGYVDLLRLSPGGLTTDQRDYVEVLARNADRLRRLVDELLVSARVVAGDPMTPETLDAVAVARDAISSVQPMAAAADVSLVLSGDASVPLVSDGQRLGQVVDNLLTNAIKFSHPGGEVRVAVMAVSGPDGAAAAEIRVADDGTGIAPDELRRITEPFYRSRESRRRRIAGVGLGLALVQALVAEHGGTLEIDSEPDRGTEVVVRLPDAPVPAQPTG